MTRRMPLLIGLFAIAAVAVAGVYLVTHPAESATRAPDVAASAAREVPMASAPPIEAAVPSPSASSPHTVEQLIADTASGDVAKRAVAITALAEAPRAQALPVLARLLTDGEPLVDRPLALQSLRDLALNQGDADGAIRDAVRHVIYHGDDFTKAEDAQEVLDIIEESQQGQ